jgi:hypothetical protein
MVACAFFSCKSECGQDLTIHCVLTTLLLSDDVHPRACFETMLGRTHAVDAPSSMPNDSAHACVDCT